MPVRPVPSYSKSCFLSSTGAILSKTASKAESHLKSGPTPNPLFGLISPDFCRFELNEPCPISQGACQYVNQEKKEETVWY